MKRSWKKQLKELYQVPEPQCKAAFLQELNYPKATRGEFMVVQAGYIRKRVWILSAVLIFAAVLAGEWMQGVVMAYPVLWSSSAMMPVLALIMVLETFRSEMYGMDELEQSARHNLPEVLLLRMGIVGGVDFLLIAAAVPIIVRYDGLSFLRVSVYLLVPYLLTCFLALCIQRWKRGRGAVWYNILASGFISGVELLSPAMKELLYKEKQFTLWVAVLCSLGIAIVIQIRRIKKDREEYQWNLYLTE